MCFYLAPLLSVTPYGRMLKITRKFIVACVWLQATWTPSMYIFALAQIWRQIVRKWTSVFAIFVISYDLSFICKRCHLFLLLFTKLFPLYADHILKQRICLFAYSRNRFIPFFFISTFFLLFFLNERTSWFYEFMFVCHNPMIDFMGIFILKLAFIFSQKFVFFPFFVDWKFKQKQLNSNLKFVQRNWLQKSNVAVSTKWQKFRKKSYFQWWRPFYWVNKKKMRWNCARKTTIKMFYLYHLGYSRRFNDEHDHKNEIGFEVWMNE